MPKINVKLGNSLEFLKYFNFFILSKFLNSGKISEKIFFLFLCFKILSKFLSFKILNNSSEILSLDKVLTPSKLSFNALIVSISVILSNLISNLKNLIILR